MRRLTILRDREMKDSDPFTLALSALGWILSDENHADRFLALTGVSPDELRARLNEESVLVAVLDFVLAHEPDTLACAQALNIGPQVLVAAQAQLADRGRHGMDADWGA
jgi:hypothetical protein